MKIVVLDGYTENPGDLSWDALAELGDLTVYDRTLTIEETIQRIGDAEAIFTNKTPVTDEVIKVCSNLKFIGVLATGYNIIDMDMARQAGIIVSNVPTYGSEAVAQYAIALLLELCHHIGEHSNAVFQGEWENSIDWCFWKYPLIALAGKTLGVIGFGRIGQQTAKIAQAMGMNILAYDRYPDNQLEGNLCHYVSLDTLFEKSDVISLHCPLFKETQGIINKNTIAKMKTGVLIINDSRGGLIVENDLKDALNSGKVGGAAVDVVSTEPIKGDNPLLKAKNMIITPHIAWAAKESRETLMEIAVNNLRAFMAGKPQNIV